MMNSPDQLIGDNSPEQCKPYNISRDILSSEKFDGLYSQYTSTSNKTLAFRIKNFFKSLSSLKILSSFFPFYSILASFYTPQFILSDLIAGLTISFVHIPQGLAYGNLAGITSVNGLYTSFFAPLIYFFLGTSRHLSVGTFSVVALLTADPVDRLADKYVAHVHSTTNISSLVEQIKWYRLEVAVTVSILSGILQLSLGLLHLGFLFVYISDPLVSAFTSASAIHVLLSQFNGLFGLHLPKSSGPGRFFLILKDFFLGIKQSNVATVITSLICVTILLIFRLAINPLIRRKSNFVIPIEIIVLGISIMVSYFAKLHENYGIAVVGDLPPGFLPPILPRTDIMSDILMDSITVAYVTLATSISLVKLYSSKGVYKVNYSQELNALGLCNIIGGFFRCQPSSGALARTSLGYTSGMRSQVASLFSCVVMLIIILAVCPILEYVPMCVLSSIISVSLETILKQIGDVSKFYRISIYDLTIWIVTFAATTFVDVPLGLTIGLGYSLLTVLYRTQRSDYCELGQIPDTDIYVNLQEYKEAKHLESIVILKFSGPVYYANVEKFRDWITKLVGINPLIEQSVQNNPNSVPTKPNKCAIFCSKLSKYFNRFCRKQKQVETSSRLEAVEINEASGQLHPSANEMKYIIIASSSWVFLDMMGMKILTELVFNYEKIGIRILFTNLNRNVEKVLTTGGITREMLARISFKTIHDAVLYAQRSLQNMDNQTEILHQINDSVRPNGIFHNQTTTIEHESS